MANLDFPFCLFQFREKGAVVMFTHLRVGQKNNDDKLHFEALKQSRKLGNLKIKSEK